MKILIVDDILNNIKLAMHHLSPLGCTLYYATSGKQALERILNIYPDLILMDVMMPEMDGYETVQRIKHLPAFEHVPVIYLTAKSDPADLAKGFACGGVDYIVKPFQGRELMARVSTHLKLYTYQRNLEQLVHDRTREVERLKDAIIEALGGMAEYRDPETGGHIKRTQYYVKLLAETLCHHGYYTEILTTTTIVTIYRSAPLHDIGKVAIRDNILLKPGTLTPEEFSEMKRHAEIGEQAIGKLLDKIGQNSFLKCAQEIAGGHHERYDGKGYPRGIAGNDIPISAAIMAVADVYDALISKRVYKNAWSHDDAVDTIMSERGAHFHPKVIDAFSEVRETMRSIADQYAD